MSENIGPICPNCALALKETLRHERIEALAAQGNDSPLSTLVAYCGSCGWTLATSFEFRPSGFGPRATLEVENPPDAESLAGAFQLRCGELIKEIQSLGFEPGGWIGLINRMGAADAAKQLLNTNKILPVTRFLVDKGRRELTMESEICALRWSDLFDETDRSEARRRLESIGH